MVQTSRRAKNYILKVKFKQFKKYYKIYKT
jgi:hypothetical protein